MIMVAMVVVVVGVAMVVVVEEEKEDKADMRNSCHCQHRAGAGNGGISPQANSTNREMHHRKAGERVGEDGREAVDMVWLKAKGRCPWL